MVVVSGVNLVKQLLPTYLEMLSHLLHSMGKNGFLHAPVFFIEWNGCVTILTSASLVSDFVVDKKIAENLRIEVLLPNKERRVGAVQHYNLHYNVALVNAKDFCAPHPANIQK